MSLVNNEKKYTRFAGNFDDHADAVAIRSASPNRAQLGLHTEPLNISIGQLFTPYRPGTSTMVIDGGDTTNTIKKLLLEIRVLLY